MLPDFTRIDYLEAGSRRQREAFRLLKSSRLMERLAPFDPLLAGTIPIGVDLPGSDLDVLCHAPDLNAFGKFLKEELGNEEGFSCSLIRTSSGEAVVAGFLCESFPVEVFGQAIPTKQQWAFRHLLAEARLLEIRGEPLRQEVIRLKESGLKTEPAFAKALGLRGDPYEAILQLSGVL